MSDTHGKEVDWNKITAHIAFELRIALARHPKVGEALSFKEGDKLVNDLASSLIYDVRKALDPDYDT